MKKIFLLFVIMLSVFAASAQYSMNGNENLKGTSSQLSATFNAEDGFIENITVYPNPVVDMLKVSFKSSRRSTAMVSLYNNIGKQVYSQETAVEPGNNVVSIDIRSKAIEPGIYFVQCTAENEKFTRKLIVR
ncbi:MAG: T9SS type A sorting domain-containing protein [Lentimicrobiaceae bacterium]|jgi:hypothetical protein